MHATSCHGRLFKKISATFETKKLAARLFQCGAGACWCVGVCVCVCVLQVHNTQDKHVQESIDGRHESFCTRRQSMVKVRFTVSIAPHTWDERAGGTGVGWFARPLRMYVCVCFRHCMHVCAHTSTPVCVTECVCWCLQTKLCAFGSGQRREQPLSHPDLTATPKCIATGCGMTLLCVGGSPPVLPTLGLRPPTDRSHPLPSTCRTCGRVGLTVSRGGLMKTTLGRNRLSSNELFLSFRHESVFHETFASTRRSRVSSNKLLLLILLSPRPLGWTQRGQLTTQQKR